MSLRPVGRQVHLNSAAIVLLALAVTRTQPRRSRLSRTTVMFPSLRRSLCPSALLTHRAQMQESLEDAKLAVE